ncbi:hypothetical protein B0A49_10511 [Cryomyces minteri]|uniref:Uncharacterized protein n=1 Tax=Cryomyces minteri TaxID=331657 RepID=A0A4V5NDT2_9PEZI|nr:hypothetical protein B0A49_10511 [Cryomyces minteri]
MPPTQLVRSERLPEQVPVAEISPPLSREHGDVPRTATEAALFPVGLPDVPSFSGPAVAASRMRCLQPDAEKAGRWEVGGGTDLAGTHTHTHAHRPSAFPMSGARDRAFPCLGAALPATLPLHGSPQQRVTTRAAPEEAHCDGQRDVTTHVTPPHKVAKKNKDRTRTRNRNENKMKRGSAVGTIIIIIVTIVLS